MMKKLISGLVLLAMLACLVLPAAAAEPTEATPSTSLAAMDTIVSTTPGASAMPSRFSSFITRLPSGFR